MNRYRWCMKKHHQNRPKPPTSKKTNKKRYGKENEKSLPEVASELDHLARKFLPDRVLQCDYSGYEADMRQEAILLALSWYLRHKMDPDSSPPWHAPKAIAAALQVQRRDRAKAIKRESAALQSLSRDIPRPQLHPSLIHTCDWPVETKQKMLRDAIKQAIKRNRISPANAAIASGIIFDGISVKDMALRLGVHRSAIYQQLDRVRREIPDILESIEVSLIDSL